MAQLIVRQLEEAISEKLKRRAREHAVSTEEEHRRILRQALTGDATGASLKNLLREIPDVGADADFARIRQRSRKVRM